MNPDPDGGDGLHKPRHDPLPFHDEVAELSVLLTGQQAQLLEQAAHQRGLTTGAMIRRLIQRFVRKVQRNGTGSLGGMLRQWA